MYIYMALFCSGGICHAVVYNAVYSACLLNAVYSACLPNAVCLYNASFLPMISAIAFYFHVLSCFIDT